MKKYSFVVIALVGLCVQTKAQTQKIIADKIIALVGDKIILQSDIVNAQADFKRQGAPVIPTECELIEGQLIQKALVLQAQKDSLVVTDDELEALLDNQIRQFIGAYGSKDVLEEVAGRTVYQIKEDFRQPFKERKLSEQMRGKILEAVKITPTEVKEYYDKIPKDSLHYYESELEVSQIILYPKANKDVEEYVSKQLYDLKKQVESGGKKFDQLAKLYSEEPAAKESGGQISLNRNDKGSIDPTFLAAAFRLKEGQISPVIKSKFGLHIIQMVSRAGDDAVVRHIIRIPPITDDEVKIAIAKLDTVRTRIINGEIPFNAAVSKFSDDEYSKFNGGSITANDGSTFVNIDQFDKDMVLALKNMKIGDISKPIAYTDERNRKAIRIIFLKSRTDPHIENLKEDFNKVAQRALEQKKQNVLQKWFRDHIPTYYINIDKNYQHCSNISQWLNVANTAAK